MSYYGLVDVRINASDKDLPVNYKVYGTTLLEEKDLSAKSSHWEAQICRIPEDRQKVRIIQILKVKYLTVIIAIVN